MKKIIIVFLLIAITAGMLAPSASAAQLGVLNYSVSSLTVNMAASGIGSFSITIANPEAVEYAGVQYKVLLPADVDISVSYSNPKMLNPLAPQMDSEGFTYFSTGFATSNDYTESLTCTVNVTYRGSGIATIVIEEIKQSIINGQYVDNYISDKTTSVTLVPAGASTIGITGLAVLDTVAGPAYGYDISVNNISRTNTIEITAKFDNTILDYINSVIALPPSSNVQFFGSPAYDTATGEYKATVMLLRQGAFFDISEMTKLLTVNFAAKPGLVNKDQFEGLLVSAKYLEMQANGIDTIALGFYRSPASVTTVISTHMRFDINGDGKLDIRDISAIILNFYLIKAGDPTWDAAQPFDANYDGIIDLEDLLIIGTYFGLITRVGVDKNAI